MLCSYLPLEHVFLIGSSWLTARIRNPSDDPQVFKVVDRMTPFD
jgi:hypothetical protein